MSKIPTYVKFSDGLWYRNPIIGIDATWFICYDDDEPIELVISAKSIGKARVMWRIIESHFRKRGQSITQRGNLRPCGERLFSKDKETPKFKHAYNVWVWISNPPADLVMRHDGVHDERPKMEGVYYD